MNKLQRNYKLVYTAPPLTEGGEAVSIEIKYPITIEMDIKRDTLAQSNTASFRLINLSKATREEIFQDAYNINRVCFVDLYAGYDDNMPLIFTGKVLRAYSGRQGTEVITEIEALDADIVQSYSSHTFEEGTPKKEVLTTLANDMPNIKLGAIGSLEGNLTSRTVFSDPTFIAINKLTGQHTFIDLGTMHTLQDNECLGDVGIYKINSDTGLIGTPRRCSVVVEVDVVFAPEILVGQLVDLESTISTEYNGQFKVGGIHHHGVISGQVGGEMITTLSLLVGALLPNSNYMVTGSVSWQPVSLVKNNKVEPLADAQINAIRDVYNYIVKNNKPPHTKITHSLYWDDVLLNFNRQGGIPSLEVLANLYSVANELQSFVDKFYPNNKIKVTSGWRSASYNATIPNAAARSAHITGQALDFFLPGQILHYVYKNLVQYWGYRRYQGNGFIHVDLAVEKGVIANDK